MEEFGKYEREARENRRGLWGKDKYSPLIFLLLLYSVAEVSSP
jgi:endonuclease YncB( thermonuclease family)